MLTQTIHMLGSERTHRGILGVRGGFLEALHIVFVHFDHVFDELLVELAAGLLGELTIGSILLGIVFVEIHLSLAGHARQRTVHLGVIFS